MQPRFVLPRAFVAVAQKSITSLNHPISRALRRVALPGLVVCLLLQHLTAPAQTPAYRWAKKAGGPADDTGNAVAVDGNGNSYAAGYFKSATATFGATILTNTGGADVFLVKYDFSGNVVWARKAGGSTNDFGTALAANAAGNTYLAGYFLSGTANFSGTILTNNGSADAFAAKYNPAGTLVWAKALGGAAYDAATGIAVDPAGNSYVTGFFYSTNATFGGVTITNAGQSGIFVAKLDSAGNVLWATQAGGLSFDSGLAIAVDASGGSYVAGNFFSQTAAFGGITLTNSGENDIFVAKYDTSGNPVWAKSVKGLSDDFPYGIAVDASSNTYVAGYFISTNLTFAPAIVDPNTSHNNDIFIAKYGPTGTPLWAQKAGGTSDDYAYAIAVDAAANVYVAGNYYSTNAAFGGITLTNLAGTNSHDIFLAKYDTAGNVLWAKQAGGTNSESAYGLGVDVVGNSYLTGYYTSSNAFFNAALLTNTNGVNDVFVSQVNGDPPTLNFTPSGLQLIFSWPTNQFGFVLQSGVDVTTSNGWTTVTNVPTPIGALNFVTNTTSGSGNLYYRLKK